MVDILATCIESGYTERWPLGHDLFLLRYPRGVMRLEHTCDRAASNRGVIVCAPEISTEPGWHTICAADPLTISPSILCGDCGLHGFIRDGQWTGV